MLDPTKEHSLRSSINHQESLNPRLSIDSHILRIVIRVTAARIVYRRSFAKNHH